MKEIMHRGQRESKFLCLCVFVCVCVFACVCDYAACVCVVFVFILVFGVADVGERLQDFYFRHPRPAIMSAKQAIEYTVLDCELTGLSSGKLQQVF